MNTISPSTTYPSKAPYEEANRILGNFLVRRTNGKNLALQITHVELLSQKEGPQKPGLYMTQNGQLTLNHKNKSINFLIKEAGHISCPEKLIARLNLNELVDQEGFLSEKLLWIEDRDVKFIAPKACL